jgi:hypothetical protein
MFCKCARVVPVPESIDIMLGITSYHGHKGVCDETQGEKNLEDANIELSHTEPSDRNNVQEAIYKLAKISISL